MIAADLLAKAESAGVRLFLEGGRLAYEGDEAAVEMVLPEIKVHRADLLAALARPPSLGAILVEACQGVPGIDAATFRALLSPEDVEDIERGHIPMVTLNAYAQSFAQSIRCGRITVLAAAIPKTTLPVRCVDCQRFERDIIGDGSGIGRCKIGGEGTRPGHPALWANAERQCKDFESREGMA